MQRQQKINNIIAWEAQLLRPPQTHQVMELRKQEQFKNESVGDNGYLVEWFKESHKTGFETYIKNHSFSGSDETVENSLWVRWMSLPLGCFPCHFHFSISPPCVGFDAPTMCPSGNLYLTCHVIYLSSQTDCQPHKRTTIFFLHFCIVNVKHSAWHNKNVLNIE